MSKWTRTSKNVIECGDFRIVTVFVKGRPNYELQDYTGKQVGFSPNLEAMKERAEELASRRTGDGNG